MFGKINFEKTAGNKKKSRKRGFTLVELCVVMLLSTLIVSMIVTFSSLISGYANENRDRVDFFEDSAKFKEALSEWMSLYDVDKSVFKIDDENKFILNYDGADIHGLKFYQGTMEIGNLKVENLNSIDKVEFFIPSGAEKGVIKCVLYRYDREGRLIDESVLIFAPRCAQILGDTGVDANE
jgi:prepilin-type N-terminal cleavage/methylation domain-containing protein